MKQVKNVITLESVVGPMEPALMIVRNVQEKLLVISLLLRLIIRWEAVVHDVNDGVSWVLVCVIIK